MWVFLTKPLDFPFLDIFKNVQNRKPKILFEKLFALKENAIIYVDGSLLSMV